MRVGRVSIVSKVLKVSQGSPGTIETFETLPTLIPYLSNLLKLFKLHICKKAIIYTHTCIHTCTCTHMHSSGMGSYLDGSNIVLSVQWLLHLNSLTRTLWF